jgi:hypothetical protein
MYGCCKTSSGNNSEISSKLKSSEIISSSKTVEDESFEESKFEFVPKTDIAMLSDAEIKQKFIDNKGSFESSFDFWKQLNVQVGTILLDVNNIVLCSNAENNNEWTRVENDFSKKKLQDFFQENGIQAMQKSVDGYYYFFNRPNYSTYILYYPLYPDPEGVGMVDLGGGWWFDSFQNPD